MKQGYALMLTLCGVTIALVALDLISSNEPATFGRLVTPVVVSLVAALIGWNAYKKIRQAAATQAPSDEDTVRNPSWQSFLLPVSVLGAIALLLTYAGVKANEPRPIVALWMLIFSAIAYGFWRYKSFLKRFAGQPKQGVEIKFWSDFFFGKAFVVWLVATIAGTSLVLLAL